MRRDVAERVNELFLECFAKLDEATAAIRQHYPAHERPNALCDVAEINAHMVMALKPVYEEYPDLILPGFARPSQNQADTLAPPALSVSPTAPAVLLEVASGCKTPIAQPTSRRSPSQPGVAVRA